MNSMMNYLIDDNGHSHHKLAWVGADGNIRTHKEASIIGGGEKGITKADGGGFVDTYEIQGRRFVCHPQQDQPTELRNATYQTSEEIKVLTAHTIAKAGLSLDAPYCLGVTLPINQFYQNDGSKNVKLIGTVRELYTSGNAVKCVATGHEAKFSDVSVYAEGMCAFYDWMLTDQGMMKPDRGFLTQEQGSIVVVDIGGSTTDIATIVFGGSMSIDHNRSGTLKKGVLDAKAIVKGALAKELNSHGFNSEAESGLPAHLVEKVFSTGQMSLGQSQIDLGAQVQKAKREVSLEIASYIKSKIGNVLAHQAILFVGGGALAFKDYVGSGLPDPVFLDEFANARGALKYMIGSKAQQRGAA